MFCCCKCCSWRCSLTISLFLSDDLRAFWSRSMRCCLLLFRLWFDGSVFNVNCPALHCVRHFLHIVSLRSWIFGSCWLSDKRLSRIRGGNFCNVRALNLLSDLNFLCEHYFLINLFCAIEFWKERRWNYRKYSAKTTICYRPTCWFSLSRSTNKCEAGFSIPLPISNCRFHLFYSEFCTLGFCSRYDLFQNLWHCSFLPGYIEESKLFA